MSRPPEIEITGGSPSPDEERAVRDAIIALWRDDQAKAAREASGIGGWRAAARAEIGGAMPVRSWRGSQPLMQTGVLLARRVGRGDQR